MVAGLASEKSVPTALLSRQLGPKDRARIEQLRREMDPVELAVRVFRELEERESSNNAEREAQLGKAIEAQEGDIAGLRAEVAAVRGKLSWAQGIASAAVALALPALGAVFWRVLDAREAEGERRVEIRILKDEVNRLRDAQPRREPAGPPSWLVPQQPKDGP